MKLMFQVAGGVLMAFIIIMGIRWISDNRSAQKEVEAMHFLTNVREVQVYGRCIAQVSATSFATADPSVTMRTYDLENGDTWQFYFRQIDENSPVLFKITGDHVPDSYRDRLKLIPCLN